ncbi:hypothetical protein MBLNU230_g5514t1 [Neophaeotheca triangularis]
MSSSNNSRFHEHLSRDMTDYPRTQTPPSRPAAPGPVQDNQPETVMSFAQELRKQTQTPGSIYSQDNSPPRRGSSPPVPTIPTEFAHLAERSFFPMGRGSLHLSEIVNSAKQGRPATADGETPPPSFNLDADLDEMIDTYGSRFSVAFNYNAEDSNQPATVPTPVSHTRASRPAPLNISKQPKARGLRANEPPPTQAESTFTPTLAQAPPTISRKPVPAPITTRPETQAAVDAFEASYQDFQKQKAASERRRAERHAKRAREQSPTAFNDARLKSPKFPDVSPDKRPSTFAPQYGSMQSLRSPREPYPPTSIPQTAKRPSLSSIGRRISDQAMSFAKKTARKMSGSIELTDHVRDVPHQPSISAPFRPQHDNGNDNVFERSNSIARPAPELQRRNRPGPMNVMPLDTNQHLAGTAAKHYHSNSAFERPRIHSTSTRPATKGARPSVSTEPSPAAAANTRREKKREDKATAPAPAPAKARPEPRRVKTVGHPDRCTNFGDFINVTSSSEESSPERNNQVGDFTPAQAPPETPITAPAPKYNNPTMHGVQASTPSTRRTQTVHSTAGVVVEAPNIMKPLPRTPSPGSPGESPSPLILKGRLAGTQPNRPRSQITQQILNHVPSVPAEKVPQAIADAHRINRMIDERPAPNSRGLWWDEPEVIVDTHFGDDGVAQWTAVHRPASSDGSEVSLHRAQWRFEEPDNSEEQARYQRDFEGARSEWKGKGRAREE